MNQELYTLEEIELITNSYRNYQLIKEYQIQTIYEMIANQQEQFNLLFEQCYTELCKAINILPTHQKLIQKAKLFKWITVKFDHLKLQIIFHEDFFTYIICNGVEQDERRYDEYFNQLRKFKDFNLPQSVIFDIIQEVNPTFNKIIEEGAPSEQIDLLNCQQMIEKLITTLDVMEQDQFEKLKLQIIQQFSLELSKLFEKMFQQVKPCFEDFIYDTKIFQLNDQLYSYQNYRYKDFQNVSNYFQIPQEETTRNSIKKMSNGKILYEEKTGVYYYEYKKSIIIIEKLPKQKVAFLINTFNHYKEMMAFIEKIPQQFQIIKIRMRNVKISLENRYLIIKWMIENSSLKNQQNGYYELYSQEHFQLVEKYYSAKLTEMQNWKQEIKLFAHSIRPSYNDYLDILKKAFVQELKTKLMIPMTELAINISIIDVRYIQSEQQSIGVLITKSSKLIGFRLMHEKQYYFFIDNPIEGYNYIRTKVKEIDVSVAEFYLNQILNFGKFDMSKTIKRFLEQKPRALHYVVELLKQKQ